MDTTEAISYSRKVKYLGNSLQCLFPGYTETLTVACLVIHY